MAHPDNSSGHYTEYDRHLMVLLFRLKFGVGAIAQVVHCSERAVRHMKKSLDRNSDYARIWKKIELESNKRWYVKLVDDKIQERINSLHPNARPKLSWEK